ncbi:unnamed protein product [Staurois parvus]|uniref:Uncharacterized protein n=1 Tax=Staurois parvus TaxID=386267 RepID=A0ABN9FLE0_9NEOB|nr:unnamed protein product [Staurois parvus]
MGPLCPCPNSKKAYEKGTRGISWGPLLTPGPRATRIRNMLEVILVPNMCVRRGGLTNHEAPGQ